MFKSNPLTSFALPRFSRLIFAALFGITSVVNASSQVPSTAEISPFQSAHNGLWFDPEVPGVLVQVYPFNQSDPPSRSAFVAVNILDDGDKAWQAFLFNDFRGFARTAVEDDVIGVGGSVAGRPFWRLESVGDTCNELVFKRFDAVGAETLSLDLKRIVTQNTASSCYTCPVPAVGPFPPECAR